LAKPSELTPQLLTAPKRANVLPPAAGYNGKLVIAGIGSPDELISESGPTY
jgi:hypothetical protein